MQGEKNEKGEKRTQHPTPTEAKVGATEESGRKSHRSTLTAEIKKLSQRRGTVCRFERAKWSDIKANEELRKEDHQVDHEHDVLRPVDMAAM
ncbi:hypothetical protein ACFX13_033760 [Malus domestica]